jgi:hypothetical protein
MVQKSGDYTGAVRSTNYNEAELGLQPVRRVCGREGREPPVPAPSRLLQQHGV